jgi:hypothetical protein
MLLTSIAGEAGWIRESASGVGCLQMPLRRGSWETADAAGGAVMPRLPKLLGSYTNQTIIRTSSSP